MSDTYIIEVRSEAAGIVVRDLDGYRFFAATHYYNPLEGQLFRMRVTPSMRRSGSPVAARRRWRKTSASACLHGERETKRPFCACVLATTKRRCL
jgi:hypothetical protein